MMLALFGTGGIAGIVGYASERSGFTQNGVVQSIIICVGGAFLFFFLRTQGMGTLGGGGHNWIFGAGLQDLAQALE